VLRKALYCLSLSLSLSLSLFRSRFSRPCRPLSFYFSFFPSGFRHFPVISSVSAVTRKARNFLARELESFLTLSLSPPRYFFCLARATPSFVCLCVCVSLLLFCSLTLVRHFVEHGKGFNIITLYIVKYLFSQVPVSPLRVTFLELITSLTSHCVFPDRIARHFFGFTYLNVSVDTASCFIRANDRCSR